MYNKVLELLFCPLNSDKGNCTEVIFIIRYFSTLIVVGPEKGEKYVNFPFWFSVKPEVGVKKDFRIAIFII
jgi:hypothetical protein